MTGSTHRGRWVLIALAALTPVSSNHASDGNRPVGKSFATRSEVIARHGMAATSHPLATGVAVQVLREGGSAVDAAIAANACLGLMEPTGCGIGGDLFAIVWDPKSRRLHGLNASGRSPRSLTMEEFRRRGLTRIPSYGPLPVSVPGCVDGWHELHARFGRRSMASNLAPAIAYAREGFPLTEVIADGWARNVRNLSSYSNILAVYAPGGRPPAKGEVFRNPALADTLSTIAREGRDAIYLCTADSDGMMVSLIQSNYRGMGSGMSPDGLGFILHDRGEAFDLAEGKPNTYAPGKRPFHTIIPAFVTRDGEPFLAFGVMGGDMQPQGHVQVLLNLFDFGMNLQEAGDAPRAYHTDSSEPTGERIAAGGQLFLEHGFPAESARDLVRLGHKVGFTGAGNFGGFQGILWDRTNRVFIGATESRKDGQAAGY